MEFQIVLRIVCLTTLAIFASTSTRADDVLIAHWPLISDSRDISGNNLHATAHNVDFSATGPSESAATAGAFDGQSSRLEVPNHKLLDLGHDEFTIAAWVFTDGTTDDSPGDICGKYDPQTRRGFHLALKTNAGVTFPQTNFRQLQFGIDDDRKADHWTDCGRPGNAVVALSMCSFDGHLYVGTCESGHDEAGHVYRYVVGQKWLDCGSPDRSNAVTSLAVFNDHLYAATGKNRLAGSSLPESSNTNLGGRVFRYDPPTGWIDCGRLPNTEAVGGLGVFQGRLYATSLYRPAGFFRYEDKQRWKECELPLQPADARGVTQPARVEAIAAYNGALYATSYDGGWVFRFDGQRWTDCGQVAENTQNYSFAVYAGQLYVGSWPSGRVYRFQEPNQWHDCGRLGEELEVMGMLVHNGRLVAGTLPLAEVYEYNGDATWQKLARLDQTPNVRYHRAWCLAENDGKVFCSTLPSGRIYSWHAGQVAMADNPLPAGWHHIAAVRASSPSHPETAQDGTTSYDLAEKQPGLGKLSRKRADGLSQQVLRIFVDGRLIAEQPTSETGSYNLSNEIPLQIGFGPNDYFRGRLSDVRLYRRALNGSEIVTLADE